jgi:hypothetical protein
MNIDKLAKEIYEQNVKVGWWDNPERCILETMQLVSTEIAEATEGERKNLMDDHLPHRIMAEVELADTLIRVLDLGGHFEWHYYSLTEVNPMFSSVGSRASMHLSCNAALILLANTYINQVSGMGNRKSNLEWRYSALIKTIIKTSELCGYDIESAMHEKLEYNKTRSDHQRENRAKENGKKF